MNKRYLKFTHYLNKGKEPYFPSEWGTMNKEITNTGDTRYHIYRVGIKFDWQKETSLWWSRSCSVEINPKEKEPLPPLSFRIPVDVALKAHTYKIGVNSEVLVNSEWKDRGRNMGAKTHHIWITTHPPRNFKVFISHSNSKEDMKLVSLTKNLLEHCGINAYVAEKKPKPGVLLWSKIESEIRTSNKILVLWTKDGAESGDVREEIGIAVGARKHKHIIPIAEVDLRGSLKGKEYSRLDRQNPENAIVTAIEAVLESVIKKKASVKASKR